MCQLAAYELLQRFPALGDGAPALRAMAAFLTHSADLVKLRCFMGQGMRSFDPAGAASPLGVFYVVCFSSVAARPVTDHDHWLVRGTMPVKTRVHCVCAGHAHDRPGWGRCPAGGRTRVAGGACEQLPGRFTQPAAHSTHAGCIWRYTTVSLLSTWLWQLLTLGEEKWMCCFADAEDAANEAPQAFQRKPMAQDVIAGCEGMSA